MKGTGRFSRLNRTTLGVWIFWTGSNDVAVRSPASNVYGRIPVTTPSCPNGTSPCTINPGNINKKPFSNFDSSHPGHQMFSFLSGRRFRSLASTSFRWSNGFYPSAVRCLTAKLIPQSASAKTWERIQIRKKFSNLLLMRHFHIVCTMTLFLSWNYSLIFLYV